MKIRLRWLKINQYLRGAVLFLLVWQILAVLIRHPALPVPWKVMVLLEQYWPDLVVHFFRSGYRILLGILLALGIGVPLGVSLGYWRRFDEILSPLVYLLYPVPKIAFLPLVLLLLGLGDLAKIFLIALIVVFQVIVVTRDGVKDLPPEYFYSIRSLGARDRQIFQHVILPAILPTLLTALRLSIGTAIAVLFFAETFATYQGLGYYILDAWMMFDYQRMFTGIVGLSLLGLCFFIVVDLVQKWLVRWK